MDANGASNNEVSAPLANTAGMPKALLVSNGVHEWIIDTGATHHMVSDLDLLKKESVVKSFNPEKVYLPNGDITYVKHTGDSYISSTTSVSDVFHIPQFKFNLISVSKLTKELQCSATFFPDFCVFQDLFTGKVREIGKEEDGLYLLSQAKHKSLDSVLNTNARANEVVSEKGNCDIELWHKRCGHVPITVLKKLFSFPMQSGQELITKCCVCPYAKQTRLPFLFSGMDHNNKKKMVEQLLARENAAKLLSLEREEEERYRKTMQEQIEAIRKRREDTIRKRREVNVKKAPETCRRVEQEEEQFAYPTAEEHEEKERLVLDKLRKRAQADKDSKDEAA